MTAYAMAHVHSTNFGPELIEYLRRIDATLEPFADGSSSTAARSTRSRGRGTAT